MNRKFNPFFINTHLVLDNKILKSSTSFMKYVGNIGNSYITYAFMKLVCGGIYKAPQIDNMHYYDYNSKKADADIDYINNCCTHVIFILQDHIRVAKELEFPNGLLNFLKKIKKTIVVISLGSNNYINGVFDKNFVDKLSKEKIYFFRELSNLTDAIGVRGHLTVEALKKIGINSAEAVGCPSYFANGIDRIINKKKYDDFKLVLGGRFFNISINDPSYVLQDELELIGLLYFNEKLPNYDFNYKMDYLSFSKKKYVTFSNMKDWENYLKKFTMYLGWRMHGAIVSLNAGIPAVLINPDSRAYEVSDLFKIPYMPELCYVNKIDIIKTYERIDLEPINREYNKLYNNFINWLKKFGIECQNSCFDYVEQPSIKLESDDIVLNNTVYLLNNKYNNKISEYNNLVNKYNNKISEYNNLVNKIAWWIPVKKWRDNFRNKMLNTDQTRPDQTRPDQTRPDQTRPDQTRPDQTRNNNICSYYICLNYNIITNKLQPMLQYCIAA